MLKIYTRTGDKGETSLFGGKRVGKSSFRIEAIGTIDELNSVIGVVISNYRLRITNGKKELLKIQNDLFEIGGALASPNSKSQTSNLKYLENRAGEFETLIDEMTGELPELRNFILPSGGSTGSHLHLARSVARRAERRIVELLKKESVDKEILIYFNRLSDLFFTMARFVNFKEKQKETIWIKK